MKREKGMTRKLRKWDVEMFWLQAQIALFKLWADQRINALGAPPFLPPVEGK